MYGAYRVYLCKQKFIQQTKTVGPTFIVPFAIMPKNGRVPMLALYRGSTVSLKIKLQGGLHQFKPLAIVKK